MGFQWSCFLSYRHSNKDGLALVEAVHDKLKFELGMHELQLYRDVRNAPGTLYNQLIAETLCASVCMVMMYWPAYFSGKHLLHARVPRDAPARGAAAGDAAGQPA